MNTVKIHNIQCQYWTRAELELDFGLLVEKRFDFEQASEFREVHQEPEKPEKPEKD